MKGWKGNVLFNKFEAESIYFCPRLSGNFEKKLKRNDYIPISQQVQKFHVLNSPDIYF